MSKLDDLTDALEEIGGFDPQEVLHATATALDITWDRAMELRGIALYLMGEGQGDAADEILSVAEAFEALVGLSVKP
jgi:hypothetical protein